VGSARIALTFFRRFSSTRVCLITTVGPHPVSELTHLNQYMIISLRGLSNLNQQRGFGNLGRRLDANFSYGYHPLIAAGQRIV
jgi:hypothetical protein